MTGARQARTSTANCTPTSASRQRRRGLLGDLIAGVSVAVVLIPQSLAYAEIAGMPPVRGLYAAALPPLVAAFLASSPHLQTGPVAITSLLTFGVLQALAPPGSAEYVQLGLMLAVVVGVIRVVLGLLRGGIVAYLMSHPMLTGFVPAAAVLIAFSQVPNVLGASPPDLGLVAGAGWSLIHPGGWDPGAVGFAVLTFALILAGRRISPIFPGVLLAVAIAIAYGHFAGYGGEVVGEIPAGLPPLSVALAWSDVPALLIGGAVIALVGFAEPVAISRVLAGDERRPWDANRELLSQGVANLTSGFSGGFPIGGSFSRSALNRIAGARTRWSGAVTGITVLAVLPVAGVLSPMPQAVLGAVVIAAVISLMRFMDILKLRHYSLPQFAVAAATFVATLALQPHLERAVLIGIGLSIAVHLWRELSIDIETSRDAAGLHLRPHGVLWYGSAQRLERSIYELVDEAANQGLPEGGGHKRMIIHLDGVGRIDVTGAIALRRAVAAARAAGVELELRGVPRPARKLVEEVVERDSSAAFDRDTRTNPPLDR